MTGFCKLFAPSGIPRRCRRVSKNHLPEAEPEPVVRSAFRVFVRSRLHSWRGRKLKKTAETKAELGRCHHVPASCLPSSRPTRGNMEAGAIVAGRRLRAGRQKKRDVLR